MRRSAGIVLGLVVFALARPGIAAGLLRVGDAFPAWTLVDQTSATVTSTELAGKTYLVWFYPKAQTPGCTAEGRGLRDRTADFGARGIEIVGVSFDTPADNAAFAKAEGFPFRLLSDRDRTLARAVGAADTSDAPVARRISYLVGPDGTVRHVYGIVTPATHASDVLADVPGS